MESKDFLIEFKKLDKYNKIGLVLAELPPKIQIQVIKSVLKDESLDYREQYDISSYLLYNSTLSRFDKKYICNHRSRLLKPKLLTFYREHNNCSRYELKRMAKMSFSHLIFLENLD